MDGCSFLRFLSSFQLASEMRCSQSQSKSREIIKSQLMTSYMIDPNNFQLYYLYQLFELCFYFF